MRKLTTTIAIVLLGFITVSATELTENKKDKSEKAKTEAVSTDFATSSYLVRNSSTIKVFVERAAGNAVSIRLIDTNGKALTNQTVWKSETSGAFQFDLSNLPDNTYSLVITNGSKTEVKQIEINTNQPSEVVREISIK
jgi:FlaG/FlaF family flagellin (archaellin)